MVVATKERVISTEPIKRGVKGGFTLLMIIGGLIVAGLIIWGGVALAKSLDTGAAASGKALTLPNWLNNIFTFILGPNSCITWESLALHLAIFVIILFAFSDILIGFSTFTETTAWVIGFGLAIIVGVTKIIDWAVAMLGITAGLGVFGIGIIIASSIFAAVLFNLGVGGPLRKWRYMRQAEISALNSQSGFDKVESFIKGAKAAADEAAK